MGAKHIRRVATATALLVTALLFGSLALSMERQRLDTQRTRLDSLARDHVRSIGNSLDRAFSATYALGALVQQGEGSVPNFDAIAAELLEYFPSVAVLALSPGGVIRQTAPLEPNRASLGFNQFEDPVQGPEARLARDSGVLTLAGPLELVQGGMGVVGRLPVFLDSADPGDREFWGLINVVIRVPDLLGESGLELLPALGLDYELWRQLPGSAGEGERQVIAYHRSNDAVEQQGLSDPVEHRVELPNGEWMLSVAPSGGWGAGGPLAIQLALALLLSLLAAGTTYLFLRLRAQQAHLETLVRERTAEIDEARSKLEGMLAAIPDLLFEVDAEGVCHGFHSPREDLLVAPAEELIGSHLERHLPPDAVAAARAAMAEADGQGWSSGWQYSLDLPQGTRWFELSVGVKPTAGRGSHRYMVLARDITARRSADEALRESEARLLHSQKLESVGRLAGGVAHDFNNLLTVIQGAASMAEEELPEGHVVLEELEQIRGSARRGAALTQQLLSYSSQQILRPRAIALNDAVQDLLGLIRRMVGESIRIETDFTAEPTWILGDPTHISQVLLNLASNARDAMPGGGTLRIATRRCMVEEAGEQDDARYPPLLLPGPHLLLQVTDTGQGMPPEVVRRIFEPFFTTKPLGEGTGLGLATAYGIIRQSGGDITCSSTPGEGTRFDLYLPAHPGPVFDTAELNPSPASPRSSP